MFASWSARFLLTSPEWETIKKVNADRAKVRSMIP